jgi:methylisocitrate lyase
MTLSQQFRQLLDQPNSLVLPGIYDCISAKIAQQCGFEAVFTSGFGIAASTLGCPDYGLLTATEMIETVGRMTAAIDIPLIADMDTGYGNPLNVIRTVEACVRLDVAGVILEDQEWPKKCGHFEGKRVIPMADHVAKLKAAIHARRDSRLVIVARTDARAPLGLEAAIRRGQAYADAGADVIFIEAPQSVAELREIAQALPNVPLFANMIQGGKTPVLSKSELEELGFKLIVHPLAGLFAATQALQQCFQHVRSHQTTTGFSTELSFPDFEQIINVPHYRQLEEQFSTPDDTHADQDGA